MDAANVTTQPNSINAVSAVVDPDTPITSPDQDELDRDRFASHLASTLLERTDKRCLVASICGPWGCGKSSFLNLVECHLKEGVGREPPIIVRFTPWLFNSMDHLTALFFHELKVGIKGSNVRDLKAKVIPLLEIMGGVLTVASLSPIAGQYFSIGATATEKINQKARSQANKPLATLKLEVGKALSDSGRRLLVLIDEVDRLDQEALCSLFRLVRMNADFDCTTYVLCYDATVVCDLLERDQPGHGEDYLKKIVQLVFQVPKPDRNRLESILMKDIAPFLANQQLRRHFAEVATRGGFLDLFETLRDVKTFRNAVRLTHPLVKGEVNAVDFMALEAIRLASPGCYARIGRNRASLAERQTAGDLSEETMCWNDIMGLPQSRGNSRVLATQISRLCEVLFPLSTLGQSIPEREWREDARICSRDVFDKYFMLGVPQSQVSVEEVRSIVRQSTSRVFPSSQIDSILEQHLGWSFLQALLDLQPEMHSRQAERLLAKVFSKGDQIWRQPTAAPTQRFVKVGQVVLSLLHRIDPERRVVALRNALHDCPSLTFPVVAGAFIVPRLDDEAHSDVEPLALPQEDLAELRRMYVNHIRNAAKSRKLATSPELLHTLYRWRDWAGIEEPRAYVSTLVQSQEGLLSFIRGVCTQVESTAGNYVTINRSDVERLVDLTQLEDRVRALTKSGSLRREVAQAVRLFAGLYDENAQKRASDRM